MKPNRLFGLGRLVVLVAAVLLLVMAVAGLAAAAGENGAARWAALGIETITPDDVAGPDDFYIVAFEGSGALSPYCDGPDPITYNQGDAMFYWSAHACWFRWYSSAASGQSAALNINAMHDECGDTDPGCDIYLSFAQKSVMVDGVGQVRGQDIVMATWGGDISDVYENFALAFDGSDVGLTAAGERIDALYMFDDADAPDDFDCQKLILLSTVGGYRVGDAWGAPLAGGGEDVLGFCAASMGWDTAGYWFVYHDGSAEGLPRNSLIGLAHEEGRVAYSRFNFLTKGAFAADEAAGGASEVFEYFGQTGAYRGPRFSFPDSLGTTDKVDSLHIFYTE